MIDSHIAQFIELAIQEDIGDGDHSSMSCIPHDATGKAQLIVKAEGIVAGIEIAKQIFEHLDPAFQFHPLIADGASAVSGDVAFWVEGRVQTLLLAERLVLNIMQRMSGIATQTQLYVKMLEGLQTKILDTRKTTPGMRFLDKMAVRLGGGTNHRMGLYDMIMLKDNHVDYAGGIENAITRARNYLEHTGKNLPIEIEVRNLKELDEALKCGGIQRIMLDNFDLQSTREAVTRIARRFEVESSGNIQLHNIRQYAECGVDFVSVGALTHQIKSLDMSLKAF